MVTTFGKRGTRNMQASVSQYSYTPAVTTPPKFVFHGSHLERHWPKYGSAAFTAFAVGYAALSWKGDLVTFAIMGPVAFLVAYRVLNGFRRAIENLHQARTQPFRSRAFMAGASLGACLYLFATFIWQPTILGFPLGGDNPFLDGFQQADLAGLAWLLLGMAGYMVTVGLFFEFVAKLFRQPPSHHGSGADSQ